jgi:large subunit ribosomal protein L10
VENPRPDKVAVVDEVKGRFSAASAALLTEYRGLDVAAISQLRRALREAGGEYKIYKNTLVRFATRDLGLEIDELLTGPTAIAFVDGDAAAVAKALRDSARTNPSLVLKGGLLGTKSLTADEVRALADLPSRDVSLGQVAGAIAAPLQQFAGLLQALPRNFAYGLKALLDERGGAPESDAEPQPAEAEPPAAEAEPQAAEAEPQAGDAEAHAAAPEPAAAASEETTSSDETAPSEQTETPAADTADDTEES